MGAKHQTVMNTLLTEPVTHPTAWGEHPPHPEGTSARQLKAGEPRTRILYVDDDALTRKLGERVLARSGYEVDTAEDGAEAWTAWQDHQYQLLITDNQMARRTGLDLIHRVRQCHRTVPIILASASVASLPQDGLPRLEYAALLAKPFTPEQLVLMVREVLWTAGNTCTSTGLRGPLVGGFQIHLRIDPHRHWGINE